ncbi:MAG: hypothetical protein ABEJ93_00740 [Candidatus Nanohalobium sp.]
MGFLDREDDSGSGDAEEEVKLSIPEEEESSEDSTGSSDSEGMLPGMNSSDSVETGSSSSVDLEDIHRQNKQIKSILKEIRSEVKDGDANGVL